MIFEEKNEGLESFANFGVKSLLEPGHKAVICGCKKLESHTVTILQRGIRSFQTIYVVCMVCWPEFNFSSSWRDLNTFFFSSHFPDFFFFSMKLCNTIFV